MVDSATQTNPAVAEINMLLQLRYAARDLSFFPRLLSKSQISGVYQSRFRGRGMDFDEVRVYQPGDDIRRIDWRVTARTTTPHTKIFKEERERPILVLTDLRSSMLFGSQELKSVTAAKVAATLSWAGLYANDKVGSLIFGAQEQHDIRAKRSHHSVLQTIHSLHDYTNKLLTPKPNKYSLADILAEARRVVLPGSTLFVISDFHIHAATEEKREIERHLFQLSRHCDVTLCHIFDKLDTELPPPGSYAVAAESLSGEFENKWVNTRKQGLRQQFEQQFRHHRNWLQQLCGKLRMGYLSFQTANSVTDILRHAYAGKSRRRKL